MDATCRRPGPGFRSIAARPVVATLGGAFSAAVGRIPQPGSTIGRGSINRAQKNQQDTTPSAARGLMARGLLLP